MADSSDSGGGTRTCPKCGEGKPTSAFSRSKATKHGFQSRCKECKKAEARAGYARNIDHHRAYGREKQRKRREAGLEKWVEVTCRDCGASWMKRAISIKDWQGRCASCAGKKKTEDPAVRARLAENARRQVEAWGGRIPVKNRNPARGERHWNWKGGVTDERQRARSTGEYISWRNAVYQRDRYTCQECGQVGGKLNAHHIKPWADFPDLRFELTNGVTLCKTCHDRLHAKEAGERLGKARDAAHAKRKAAA